MERIKFDRMILVGDTHFGFMSNSLEWLDNSMDFFYKLLIPYLKEVDPSRTVLVMAGDTYDKKQVISTIVQNRTIDLFEELGSMLEVHILLGNHDSPRLIERHIHNCKALNHIPGINVHVEPAKITSAYGQNLLLMPWMSLEHNPDAEREVINANTDCEYAVAHTDILGFVYENKKVDNPASLSKSDLAHFKMFWSGHIHKRQQAGNITYVGAPYHTRKVEYKNKCGFEDVTFTPDGHQSTYVVNDVTPRHIKVGFHEMFDSTVEQANALFDNNYVSLRVTSNQLMGIDMAGVLSVLAGTHKGFEYEMVSNYYDPLIEEEEGSDREFTEDDISIDIGRSITPYVNSLMDVAITKRRVVEITDDIRPEIIKVMIELHNHCLNNHQQ